MTHYSKSLYPGTFDPFTNGHLDIVRRATLLFNEVTVLVAKSPTKNPLFSVEERIQMLKEIFEKMPTVKVESWGGLVVDYAKKNGIGTVVRGLRPTGDFEIEFQMASMNKGLYSELETVFLITNPEYYYISSTLVREVSEHGGEVKPFVPAAVYRRLQNCKKK